VQGCVASNNIESHTSSTVEECKIHCNNYGEGCKGFEFGVAYGGDATGYGPGDCVLNSSADQGTCDGSYWNTDFYTKVYN